MSFLTLTKEDVGKVMNVVARIERIHQTSGPTLFTLFDGSGNLSAKAFLKPGKRAFEAVKEGDVVQAALRLQEYEGHIEAEILGMELHDTKLFDERLAKMQEEKYHVEAVPFLVQSEWLEKLRERFVSAARLIKKAVFESRPIVVRHNADCDGYSGAIALERAIVPLILEHHKDSYSQWKYYRRAPSKAPFYAYSDAVLDVVTLTNEMAKNGMREPLIIIVDNGSGVEDVFGIKQVRTYGCPVIVVDHHFFAQDVISGIVDVHINPYLAGYNSQICAGMLGVELARFVNPAVQNITFLAALAGTGDKVVSPEMDQYRVLAEKENYSADYLKQLALCIDFEAYYLRFVEGRGLVDDLMGADKEKERALVTLVYPEARARIDRVVGAVKHYITLREVDGKTLALFDLDKIASLGDFPPFGKIAGAVSDWLKEKHTRLYVLAHSSEMIVLRVSKEEMRFNLNTVVAELQRQKPHACVTGGGHERAGTIKFVAAAHDEVLEFVADYISGL